MEQHTDGISKNKSGVMSMGLNWVLSAGSIIVALVMTQLVSKVLYPLVILAMCMLLYAGVRNNRASRHRTCYVLPFIMSRVYFLSALVMIFINLLHRHGYIFLFVTDVDLLNPEIPYIAILIIGPITTALSIWALLRRQHLPFCAECIRHNGTTGERGFLGEFYSREGRYQLRLMTALAGFCTLGAYVYYFIYYINVNLNSPDLFFFVVAPSLIFAFSIVYVAIRYAGLWQYSLLNIHGNASLIGNATKVRFLIFSGEKMLLNVPDLNAETDIDDMRIDTPVKITVRLRQEVSPEQAHKYFRSLSGIDDDVDIRPLYVTSPESSDFSTFLFAVDLPSTDLPADSRLQGSWFTLDEVMEMLNAHMLMPILSAEIVRLHRIIMAWKMYDRDGNRRYAIKSYRPMFRLSDIYKSDIDYNDRNWLYVADINEDSRLYRLRRFWSRFVSRTIDKKPSR